MQGEPYKLADVCLKDPKSSDADYRAMYDSCVKWLRAVHKM